MEDVNKWVNEGMRFITYGYDSKFIKDSYKESLLSLRHIADGQNKK
jgi:4-hydroxy-2-oxoheptanedioate aldolase